MKIQAWTFLISRNQSIDYKTVVAPDFIDQAKIRSLLLKVSDEDFTEAGKIYSREVQGSEVGNFSIVFRSVKATGKDIGADTNEVLKDPFGREIYWLEGLVFRNNQREVLQKIGETHLNQTHKELQPKYKEFWHEDKLSVSHAIDWVDVKSEPGNKSIKLETFVIPSKSQLSKYQFQNTQQNKGYRGKQNISKFILIGIIALFLMSVGIWWRLHSAKPNICLYVTETQTINFDPKLLSKPKLFGIQGLEKVKNNNHNQPAWVWLEGDLIVDDSLLTTLKDVQKNLKENEKTLLTTEHKQLKMKYYPIEAAITLLQNQNVVDGKLTATIIKPNPANSSTCGSHLTFAQKK